MKCKDCECHSFVSSCQHGYCSDDYRDRGHWCSFELELADNYGYKFGLLYMSYKEFLRVSKKEIDCPKTRKFEYVNGKNIEIIAVKPGIYGGFDK